MITFKPKIGIIDFVSIHDNQNEICKISSFAFHYTYRSVSHSAIIVLQEIWTNTETHDWTMCREWETQEHLVLNEMLSNSSLKGSESNVEEEEKRF